MTKYSILLMGVFNFKYREYSKAYSQADIESLIELEFQKLQSAYKKTSQADIARMQILSERTGNLASLTQKAAELKKQIDGALLAIEESLFGSQFEDFEKAYSNAKDIYTLNKLEKEIKSRMSRISGQSRHANPFFYSRYSELHSRIQHSTLDFLCRGKPHKKGAIILPLITLLLFSFTGVFFLIREFPNIKREQSAIYQSTQRADTQTTQREEREERKEPDKTRGKSAQIETPETYRQKQASNLALIHPTREQEQEKLKLVEWSEISHMASSRFIYFERALCTDKRIDVAKRVGHKITLPDFKNLEGLLNEAYRQFGASGFTLFSSASDTQPAWYKHEDSYYAVHSAFKFRFANEPDTRIAVITEGKESIQTQGNPDYTGFFILEQSRDEDYKAITTARLVPIKLNNEISFIEIQGLIIGRLDYCSNGCRFELNIAVIDSKNKTFKKIFSRTVYGSPSEKDPLTARNWQFVNGIAILRDLNNDGSHDLILGARDNSISNLQYENSTNTLIEAFLFNGSSYTKTNAYNIDEIICQSE